MPRSTLEASAAAADELDRVLAEVATALEGDLDALARRVADEIHAEMPELGDHARVTGRTLAAVRSNIAGFLAYLRDGVPAESVEVTPETADYARAFVHRGIGLPSAIRCFRLGHEHLWRAWAEAIDHSGRPPELRATVLEVVSASLFQFIDRTTIAVVEAYQAERDRWNRSADARRAEVIQAILDGRDVDVDAASRQLTYELGRWHLGMVLWHDDEGDGDTRGTELQRAAVDLAERLSGSSRPLVQTPGATVVWVWVGSPEQLDDAPIAAVCAEARQDGIRVAIGEPGHGLDGFRTTHESAMLARRVMQMAPKRLRTANRFRATSLLSLLSTDLEQMRRFVAAELGDLAVDDDATARLRATLLVFFDERSSAVKTGRRLGVHTNTINYRVRRCAELIGHPVHERRPEIETALRLKQALGAEAFGSD